MSLTGNENANCVVTGSIPAASILSVANRCCERVYGCEGRGLATRRLGWDDGCLHALALIGTNISFEVCANRRQYADIDHQGIWHPRMLLLVPPGFRCRHDESDPLASKLFLTSRP